MNENNLNIKIGDMIQSDTGACGIVVRLPVTEKNQYDCIINWNRGEPKEWGTDPKAVNYLVNFGKWKVVPL